MMVIRRDMQRYRRHIFGILLAPLVLLWSGQAIAATCIAPLQGLMSWWPGEGNATDVLNGNVGTPQGGVTYVPGQVGQAFSFDGTGQVVIADQPDLDLQRFTLAVWIFPTLLNGEETRVGIRDLIAISKVLKTPEP